ncbi:hypothetical protein Mapa_015575 [Marchantia paleacea]|nr:hypothetical protein Mapa_015575 [Marchantia paleacea]
MSQMEGSSSSSEERKSSTGEFVSLRDPDPEGISSWDSLRDSLPEVPESHWLQVVQAVGSCKTVTKVDNGSEMYCSLTYSKWVHLRESLKTLTTNSEESHIRVFLLRPTDRDSVFQHGLEAIRNGTSLPKLVVDGRFEDEYGGCMEIELPRYPDAVVALDFSELLNQLAFELNRLHAPQFKPFELSITVPHLRASHECTYTTEVFNSVAQVIRSSSGLRKLDLRNVPVLCTSGLCDGALLTAFKQCLSLGILTIEGCEGMPQVANPGMTRVLCEAFKGEGSNQCLQELNLIYAAGAVGRALPDLLTSNISNVSLHVDMFDESEVYRDQDLWRSIGLSLRKISGLRRFSVSLTHLEFQKYCTVAGYVEPPSCEWMQALKLAWSTSGESPLFHISLQWTFISVHVYKKLFEGALSLGCLRRVHLKNYTICSKELIDLIMQSLKSNPHLNTISFDPNPGERTSHDTEDLFDGCLELVRDNFALQEIHVKIEDWERSGKVAQLQEALNRNKRLAEYISVVRDAGLEFGRTKAGRVILCGSPYAGKTRLKKTMLNILMGNLMRKTHEVFARIRSKLEFLPDIELLRTEGIEIATLRDDEEMLLTVWDLAGQWIFRALQDLLFPTSGLSCIFIFLFNSFEQKGGKLQKKLQLEIAFKEELISWLRFLASNSPVLKDSPPAVLVVLSHADKMHAAESQVEWARPIVDQLRSRFQGAVELLTDVRLINCCDPSQVSTLTPYIFRHMEYNFKKLHVKHVVPAPGIELAAKFRRRSREIRRRPLWTSYELHEFFCSTSHALHKLRPVEDSSRIILQALTRYLHDTGTIFIVPDSDLIVVDPNWMSYKFLGKLIGKGVGQGHDGFISKWKLDDFLSRLTLEFKKEHIHVPQEDLRTLLLKLNLCFKLDIDDASPGDPRYFMPAVVGGPDETLPARRLKWNTIADGSQDFGYRLQCHDRERTILTRSFFPTFQIKLWNMLARTLGMNDQNVSCGRGRMEIRVDGHEIFLESDRKQEDHIDIMVRPSAHRTNNKEVAREFVEENIIQLLRSFCASEMGCPGVSLSSYILRTECVSKLTPCDLRTDYQAISVEELKQRVINEARMQLEKSKSSRTRISMNQWYESCMKHSIWWPAIEGPDQDVHLATKSESAASLLPLKVALEIKEDLQRLLQGVGALCAQERTREDEVIRLNDLVYEIHKPLGGVIRIELVFVHGILEDESDEMPHLTTWSTRHDPRECWLNTWLVRQTNSTRLLSEIDMKFARVLTVSYDSSVTKTHCTGNMDNFLTAETLTYSLIKLAGVGQIGCPVVLVGHCLGGLVIKEVCNHASRRAALEDLENHVYENFLKSVKGLFFYSTPHLGFQSRLVKRGSSSESASTKGDLMQSLEVFNARTSRLNSYFSQIREKYGWRACGVGESNETKICLFKDYHMDFVVREASARAGSEKEFCVLPDTDHFTICRPESETSNSFLHLIHFVRLCTG